jgi:tripartite-type tricarboxylate transporter receptor subunit TctC
MPQRLRRCAQLAFAFALWACAQVSGAADYPSRPIRIVVIVSPGGSGDTVARLVGEKLSARFKQPVIVDNRPGAGGNLATQAVAKSPNDGYTLLLTANNHTINPSLFASPGYAIDDLVPVAELMEGPSVIAVGAESPYKTLADLLADARNRPAQIAFGSAGVGLPSHIAGELLQRAAGIKLVHVAYRGSGPSITDAIGGQVPIVISTLVAAMPHIQSGKLRALAVTSNKRWPLLPEVPAASEFGMPSYEHMTWLGLFSPKGTPAEVVSRLNAEVRAVISQPEFKAQIARQGGDVMPKTPEQFDAMVKKEYVQSTRLVIEAHLKAQ